ncbi:HNH endonuclease [Burkholderia stabilis]|uniref:HNH endonuclease n=1 Tax=Burkholderia stabilis TaxID=95485 RepID=UPI0018D5A5D0|nr:HNH endonuclease [Burkholderia stabilis]
MDASLPLAIPPCPTEKEPVRVLLERAGLNVDSWAFTKDGEPIENPNNNIGRNTSWAFVGEDNEPVVLCLWYDSPGMCWDETPAPIYRGNEYQYQRKLKEMLRLKYGPEGEKRLKTKIARSSQLHNAVWEARGGSREVRLLLVDGDTVPIEESADRASTVSARSLDPGVWFVHEFDGVTGNYTLVRGIRPVRIEANADDLVDADEWEPEFLEIVGALDSTVRDAIIKARIGQGKFRNALLERWEGSCSVTGISHQGILIASHIKPWSHCESKYERWSPANGLLLTPNLDKLFDSGLISFDDDFRMLVSPQLKSGVGAKMNAHSSERLRRRDFHDTRPFLAWHRKHYGFDN